MYVSETEGMLKKKSVELKNNLPPRAKADLILSELKKEQAVPEKLTLHEMAVDEEGVIYLNFSQDLKAEKASPLSEIATVYSIVNSFLANFKGSKSVQLLVEGEPVYTVSGLLYTYEPLEFNNQIVEE